MTRLDAHIHLFQRGYREDRDPDAELEQYAMLRERHDVVTALAVGYEGDPHLGNNEYLLDIAAARPWIAPAPYLHLDAVTSAREVEGWWARGAVGVAVYAPDAGALDLVDAAVWEMLARRSAVISVNAPAHVWAQADGWLRRVAGAQVLVSHLGLPGDLAGATADVVRERTAPVLELAAHDGVSVKLSGAYAVDPVWPHAAARPVVEEVLAAFGAARVAWGSDFWPGLETLEEDQLFAMPPGTRLLSPDERDLVSGGTLRAILDRVQHV
ncbi:MAG: amidohydrolase family protein [Actinomycetota bacterium]